MITGNQIRAARALLDLSQHEVSDAIGITKNALSKLEKGKNQPSGATATKLEAFFMGAGIALGPNEGVCFQKGDVIYKGTQGIRSFFDDVYSECKRGGDIRLFNGVPHLLLHWLGEDFYTMHATRMAKIKNNFSARIIIEEGNQNFIAGDFSEYRWFPKEKFNERTIYIYGPKVGFFAFSKEDVHIRVIKDEEEAQALSQMFDICWMYGAEEVR